MRKNATKCETRPALEWPGLQELTKYAAVSERTLRKWIHSTVDPLPATRVCGKILVNRRAFDDWLRAHPVTPAKTAPAKGNAVMRTTKK